MNFSSLYRSISQDYSKTNKKTNESIHRGSLSSQFFFGFYATVKYLVDHHGIKLEQKSFLNSEIGLCQQGTKYILYSYPNKKGISTGK